MKAKKVFEFIKKKSLRNSIKKDEIGINYINIRKWAEDHLKDNDWIIEDNILKVKKTVDLRNKNITWLPNNLNVGWDLILSNNPITKLPENLSVESLNINNTSISKIPDSLKIYCCLNMENTKVTEIPNIKYIGIYAANSPINKIPENLFVRDLDISNTNVTELPKDLKIENILDISNTKIKRLPWDIDPEVILNISNTEIKYIPPHLDLEVLNISNTQITRIPPEIKVSNKIIISKNMKDYLYIPNHLINLISII